MHRSSHLFNKKTDEELLLLIRQNNDKAFSAIYDRYHKLLYALAYRYLKDKNLSMDAVQQVFLKLWESRSLLTINVNLKNYLFTMLKNHVLNEIRNNLTALEKIYELSQSSVYYVNKLIEELEEKELTQQLYHAIDKLPTQKRLVCLYKLKESLSNQEIADEMGISVATVKSHYSEAIKMLRAHFNKILFMLLASFL